VSSFGRDEWEREYDPAELGPDEGWIAALFEPVRKSFFNGPVPPALQFMMPEKCLPKGAEVAVLAGLHPSLGGPFKLAVLFRRLKCVQVFECVTQGRQWWYTLHLATDARFSLRELQPTIANRQSPFPKWWTHGAGSPYPVGVGAHVSNDVVGLSQQTSQSVLVKRDAADEDNLSGGVETLIPERLLLGVIPQAILVSNNKRGLPRKHSHASFIRFVFLWLKIALCLLMYTNSCGGSKPLEGGEWSFQ
jgi:hypothetical protein